MKKLLFFTLAIICSACSFEQDGLVTLRELCEKDAGLTIYKTVEANGYYDATRKGGVLRLLIPSDFSFTEFCNFKPNITSLFKEASCWRLTKITRKNGQCDKTIDNRLWRYDSKGYFEFKENHCISVKKIEKPTARYSYQSGSKAWTTNGTSEFRRSYALFRDREDEKVLSEYISYSYNKNPGHTIAKSCHFIDDKFSVSLKKNFIEKTIITDKEDQND